MNGVNVEIMGQNLVVTSDEGEDRIRELAQAVDARIRNMRETGRFISSVNLAILAALNFAQELDHLKREHQEIMDHIEALNRRLADAMEGWRR